jgi:DNA topoisomerase IA
MSPAEYDLTTVRLLAGEHPLRASGSVLVFKGFLALGGAEDDEEAESAGELPAITEGDLCRCLQAAVEEHFTEPPPRYTEATLVKALEERGIGRPSTYAPTIQTIQDRSYVERQERRLLPTELGELVDQMLSETPSSPRSSSRASTGSKRGRPTGTRSCTSSTSRSPAIWRRPSRRSPRWSSPKRSRMCSASCAAG